MANQSSDIPVRALAPGSQAAVPVSCVVREHRGEAEAPDPDHHLWRNGRRWWIAFTIHRGHQQERVRFSLKTDDITAARRRRDRALALFERARDCEISLRFPSRRAAGAQS